LQQNNVGVDSYQTTYEQAFIAAAEENDDVEVVVLDAGGDVARQIAQIQDLIQQEVDAMIIWPTNGQAVIPAVREAYQAEIPVIITNSNIAEDGFDFVTSFSGPDNITQGARSAEIMCDVHRTGHPGRGPRRRDHRSARLHDRHRAQRRLPGASARGLPQRDAGRQPAGQLEP
jgi:ABC-type sugar transport system substrate-binding protein